MDQVIFEVLLIIKEQAMEILIRYLENTKLDDLQIQKIMQYIDFLKFQEKQNGHILPYPEKEYYSVTDLEGILAQYPIDKKWTYTDFTQAFPETSQKIEIIENQILIMPSPNEKHQDILFELAVAMRSFVKKDNLGKVYIAPLDVILDEDNTFQPDIFFILEIRRQKIVEPEGKVKGNPDLVVEVISPANYKTEREKKKAIYEKSGVTEYWEIRPKQRQITIEVLKENGYELFSEAEKEGKVKSYVLEGFEIAMEDLLPESEQ